MAREVDLGSIIGPQGEKGPTGATGPKGPQGETGPTGKSAYQVCLHSLEMQEKQKHSILLH